MRRAHLPPEFVGLRNTLTYVQKQTAREYSSECPKCGGTPHRDGEWPDRFRLFDDGKIRGWCRKCNFLWFPDMEDDWEPLTDEERERFRKERERKERARKRSAERALRNLRQEEFWKACHEALTRQGRKYWETRGIPEFWQDYWRLGWQEQYEVFYRSEKHYTPTATIPFFSEGWTFEYLKHRLINPPAKHYKYHNEIRHIPTPIYRTEPDKAVGDHVIAVEGEIKAMVTYITLDDPDLTVVGLPGTNPPEGELETLSDAERVTLVFDPGADAEARRVAEQLGRDRCRLLIPPMDIDDAIRYAGLGKAEVRNWIRQAERV